MGCPQQPESTRQLPPLLWRHPDPAFFAPIGDDWGTNLSIYIYLCNIMQLEYEGPNFFLLQKLRPVQAAELASKDLAP
jgi:hypothetical protein